VYFVKLLGLFPKVVLSEIIDDSNVINVLLSLVLIRVKDVTTLGLQESVHFFDVK